VTGLAWGIEAEYRGLVFGVDEVGRGPWAGPVTAAAACLSCAAIPAGLADSKALPASTREHIAAMLKLSAHIEIGWASVEEIDALNILAATHLAMIRAVTALAARIGPPAMILVDGNRAPPMPWPTRTIVKGDAAVASIAAASISAKVTRDAYMVELAIQHPAYSWASNKGYGVAVHAAALEKHGVSPHHRRSFAPIRKLLGA